MIRFTKCENHWDLAKAYWVTGIDGAKFDRRHYIHTLHIDSGVAVKTDGSRLHAACFSTDIPDGDYEIIKRTKSEVVINRVESKDWADWESVLEIMPKTVYHNNKYSYCLFCKSGDSGGMVGYFYYQMANNGLLGWFNADFVADVLSGFENAYALVWISEDNNSPLFVFDENLDRVAAVMPRRV